MSSDKGRFVMVPIYIAENPALSASAKAVYIALKSHLPNIRCSTERINALTGLSKPTIIKVIKELERWRLIQVKRAHRHTNSYEIQLQSKSIKTEDYLTVIRDLRGVVE